MSLGNTLADVVATGPLLLGLCAAALAGLVSFASPCVVPLVPGYLSYLAATVGGSTTVREDGEVTVARQRRRRVVGAAVLFVLGFSVVFVLATVTVFGAISALRLSEPVLTRAGGAITILMGMVFLGWGRWLQKDTRLSPRRWATFLGAPLLGAVFALGWTPCLGPTLAAIISVAAGTSGVTAARGTVLILGYCVGLGVPFVLLAFGSSWAVTGVGWLRRHTRAIQVCGGVLMILVGLCLLTGVWAEFIGWIRQWTVDYGTTVI